MQGIIWRLCYCTLKLGHIIKNCLQCYLTISEAFKHFTHQRCFQWTDQVFISAGISTLLLDPRYSSHKCLIGSYCSQIVFFIFYYISEGLLTDPVKLRTFLHYHLHSWLDIWKITTHVPHPVWAVLHLLCIHSPTFAVFSLNVNVHHQTAFASSISVFFFRPQDVLVDKYSLNILKCFLLQCLLWTA